VLVTNEPVAPVEEAEIVPHAIVRHVPAPGKK
jgi:hypothetical protein